MDPATIIGTAFSVSKVVFNCSATLYSFVENVAHIDKNISALYAETESLQSSLTSITKALQTPSVKKHDKLPLWEDVNACLKECQKTVEDFYRKLESIRPKQPGKANIFKASVQQFKLTFREEDIHTYRAQIKSHSSALQWCFK